MRLHSLLLELFQGIRDTFQPLTGVFASWTERTLNKWIFQQQLKFPSKTKCDSDWVGVGFKNLGEGGGGVFSMVFEPFYFRKDAYSRNLNQKVFNK